MKSVLILLSFTLLTLGAGSTALASEDDYRAACHDGDAKECLRLGDLEFGRDNFSEGLKYYAISCGIGHFSACFSVWIVECVAENNKERHVETIAGWLETCGDEDMPSCAALGGLYHLRDNYPKAKKYHKKACDLDFVPSCGYMSAFPI